jgi:hypothetical protein
MAVPCDLAQSTLKSATRYMLTYTSESIDNSVNDWRYKAASVRDRALCSLNSFLDLLFRFVSTGDLGFASFRHGVGYKMLVKNDDRLIYEVALCV